MHQSSRRLLRRRQAESSRQPISRIEALSQFEAERAEAERAEAERAEAERAGDAGEVSPAARCTSKAYRDETRGVYVVYLSQKQNPVAVPFETHAWMRRAYSNWYGDPMSPAAIADAVGLTPDEFSKYRSVFGWTREMNPIGKEQMLARSVEEITDEIVRVKETLVRSRLDTRALAADRADAEKWRSLRASVLAELKDAIERLPQQTLSAGEPRRERAVPSSAAPHRLILPLNDWQVGAYADARELRFGRQFDEHVLERMVDDYCRQLGAYLDRQPDVVWGEPVIVLLGDLLHGLTGFTVHGTNLSKHMRQFDAAQVELALRLMTRIVDMVAREFGAFKIVPVAGNHDGAAVHMLAELFYQRWRGTGATVARTPGRTHYEMIGSSLFIFDHGASPDSGVTGGKIARSGARRDAQIKDLVLARPELYAEARRAGGGVYFVMGDQHHAVDESMAHVELVKLPTLMSGDVYADHNGWYSRPAQTVLLVDEAAGLRHAERFYLDSRRVFGD